MFTSTLNYVWHYHFSFICQFFSLPTFIKCHMWDKEIYLYTLLSESEFINRCAVTNLQQNLRMGLATDHKIHVIHSDYFMYFTHGYYILVTEIWTVLLGNWCYSTKSLLSEFVALGIVQIEDCFCLTCLHWPRQALSGCWNSPSKFTILAKVACMLRLFSNFYHLAINFKMYLRMTEF